MTIPTKTCQGGQTAPGNMLFPGANRAYFLL